MYRVYCNNSPLYDLRDEDLVLISPIVKIGENTAGSFEFSILPKHPHYEEVNELTSVITAYDGDEEIFCGRVVEITKDLYNRKKVICEGELAYFNDSIQRPARYQGLTVRGYLETLVNIHNQQVKNQGIDKTFKVGAVTVQDKNDYVYKYTNWESTLEVIKTDLLKTYGGYLRIRKENGVRYLDYLADYPNTNTNTQVIEFGSNLLDFTHDMVASDIVTAVIPLGARLEDVTEVEGLDAYLTIKDVNGGVDYVYSQEAVKSYGWIFKTVKWDDVHVADNLLKKGKEYLTDIQFAQITLTVSAVDLHMLHVDMERIKVLDEIRVTSSPNGLDRFFPVSEMTIYLDKPSNNKLTLGTSYSKNSLSTKTESNMTSIKDKIDSLPNKSEILEEARENASQLIHSATNGHVVTTADEQLIMDTADKKTARKLWRWNLNGLGYSKTGYNGTYDTAITMDGQIVGERLIGGSVTADKLSVSYKSSVEKQISDAIDDSNDYTDDKLKSYWTRVEVETAIKNTKDAVLISAKETATSYTDDKLKSYSTSAQIKVKTDSIESEVKKKLNSSELSTKIQQNASAVKIAWNNISKYVQFESGELRIYDSAVTSSQKLVSKFNYNGCHFYRNNYYVGKIGTNELQSDSSKKGLNFDLESNGAYMTWASKDSSSANVYTMKWTYVQKGKGWGNYTAGELHAGCNVDMHGWTLKNPSFEGGGINGTLNFVQILRMDSDGTVASWSNGCKMQFKNGILISGTWNG